MIASFKEWLILQEGLEQFDNNGTLTLYHFTRSNQPELLLQPEKFGANYFTKNDFNISSTPRTFFYLDPTEKETHFNSATPYQGEVSADRIYDLIADPLGLKEEIKQKNNGVLNFSDLIEQVAKLPDFDGVYYRPGFHVVALFKPLRVRKIDDVSLDQRSGLQWAS